MCFDSSPPPSLREQVNAIRDEANERLPLDEPALPTIAPEITAVVHDAKVIGGRLIGAAYDHARFHNGDVIRTSPIVATYLVHVTKSGSYYLVEDNRANPEAPTSFARAEKRGIRDNPQA
jgi:hypothetical protein